MKSTVYPIYLFLLLTILLQSCIGYNIAIDTYAEPKSKLERHRQPAPDWEDIPIYFNDERPTEKYDLLARIIVTGNESASDEELWQKMKKEAGYLHADAILLLDNRTIDRETFNGFALAINVISIAMVFTGADFGDVWVPVEDEYQTGEIEGIAIRFKRAKEEY